MIYDICCQEKEGPRAILTFHLWSHGRIVACHWPGLVCLPSLFHPYEVIYILLAPVGQTRKSGTVAHKYQDDARRMTAKVHKEEVIDILLPLLLPYPLLAHKHASIPDPPSLHRPRGSQIRLQPQLSKSFSQSSWPRRVNPQGTVNE